MKKSFVVTVEMPLGVGSRDMSDYIRDAVRTWCGSFDPENDPLFDLDRKSVKVKPMADDKPNNARAEKVLDWSGQYSKG